MARRGKAGSRKIALRLDRVGEIEEAAGVYAETKIEELAERKLRFDKPELAQQWDKSQRREREGAIPKIEQSRSLEEKLVQSLLCLPHQKTNDDAAPCSRFYGDPLGRTDAPRSSLSSGETA